MSENRLISDTPNCLEPESSNCILCVILSIYNNELKIMEIALHSQDVSINQENLVKLAEIFAETILITFNIGQLDQLTSSWLRHQQIYPIHYDNNTLDWLFMLNALNFSLWNPKATKQWTVCGQTGFKALYFAIKRAIDVGRKPLWCPSYYTHLSSQELNIIFRSDDNEIPIPLIEERKKVLHEIGTVLLNKFQGTFANCINLCGGDGYKLLSLLYKEFESYRDIVNYEGKQGSKAITLLSDLKYFHQISDMHYNISTMFVDYCSPQVLLRFGILSYSDTLKTRLEQDEPLKYGSREEVEIRCCSLFVCNMVEYYVLQMCETLIGSDPLKTLCIFVDNFLWHYRHTNNFNNTPLHDVKSIYY